MSFFGFEEKDADAAHEKEEVPVFTWGEDSYNGLGDVLQEGGDELNDETFGTVGIVGKDFDFSNATLPSFNDRQREQVTSSQNPTDQAPSDTPFHLHEYHDPAILNDNQLFDPSNQKTESIWDNKSPFSLIPQLNENPNHANEQSTVLTSSSMSSFPVSQAQEADHWESQKTYVGARTVEDIEAEMRAAAQRSRVQQKELLYQQQVQREEDERQRTLHEQELQRQVLHQQEQHQIYVQRLLQQQREHQYQRTTPPRMLPTSQSPRFLEHQRQLLLLQQQQRAQELQEQLMLEEMDRQMLARPAVQQQHRQSPILSMPHNRQSSSLSLGDLYGHQQRQTRSQSPTTYPAHLQESLASPQNIQLQQRILSEMAQAEFNRNMQTNNVQGINSPAEQEAIRSEAMRKILEAERMEEKRRRKAAKIAYMSRYNDLMTQSDKDFITRIQVSQLVTQDPYADDFYAQVYGAILRSRMGLQSQDDRVLKFGSGGGVGLGLSGPKGGGRRPSAMQRMEQQVERIVTNARKREEEKGSHALQSLQGALGKTSGRSYKAAPRQLLQVDTGSGVTPTSHVHASKESDYHVSTGAEEAAKLGRETLGDAANTANLIRKQPLTHRETLTILERLYDLVLQVEQVRRDHYSTEDEQQAVEWQRQYTALVDQIWDTLGVMVPLETSDPHPFISLLIPGKGKRVLPRIVRHLDDQRMLTLFTLLVACFSQLDVVKQILIFDLSEDALERAEAEEQIQLFSGSVLHSILPVVAKASLRLVTGLLGLLLDRSNIVGVAQTRPGLALLTLFLSRVELIKLDMTTAPKDSDSPSPEEVQQWQLVFDHLFQSLASRFLLLFPSTRMASTAQTSLVQVDLTDQPVWQFFAALALHAGSEQQHTLVTTLREKILDNVSSVNKGWIRDDEERQTKLANVNLLLHALGLDSSQIVL